MKSKTEDTLLYRVEVLDKQGKLIKMIEAPSRSYVCAWNQAIYGLFVFSYTIIDTSGTPRSAADVSDYFLSANAGAGVSNYGIRVGKGFTPVAITDYALESPCGQGAGTDQFLHQATSLGSPIVLGNECSFWIRRVIVNNSGSTISGIREIGCYMSLYSTTYALAYRDILPDSVDVPDGGSITVTYTLKVIA